MKRRLRILTWHVHGNYLWYLSQAPHDFYLPVRADGVGGYHGRGSSFPFGDNVIEVPADKVAEHEFDCVLYQARQHYLEDRQQILSDAQRRLPSIYIEHDPPLGHPTDTKHWVQDPNTLLVHVTPFNRLMWDSGVTPTRVIDHGVIERPGVQYTGELPRGLVVVNNLGRRGRRLGPDVFEQVAREVPLDLVGMNSQEVGGLGEILPTELAAFAARYRFFFNPIRYTSLGLAVCEAMLLGMPVIGLATTEMATAVQNGVSGYVDTNVDKLICHMLRLLKDRDEAQRLGAQARQYALGRFHIGRFAENWDDALRWAVEHCGQR
jgi:hypothetical protein